MAVLVLLIFVGLAPVPAQQAEPGAGTELQEIRRILKEGNLDEARRRAQALLDALDRQDQGETAEAADTLDLVLEIMETPDPKAYTTQALPLAARASELRLRLEGETLAFARSLKVHANWLVRAGRHEEARPVYERALAMQERLSKPDNLVLASTLNGLGVVAGNLGDWPTARSYYERALSLLEQFNGFERREARVQLNNLTELLEGLGDYAAARDLQLRLLSDLDRRADPDTQFRIRVLARVAWMDHFLGDDAGARENYENARAKWEALRAKPDFAKEQPNQVANTATRLAATARVLGELEEARRLYLIGIDARERAVGADHEKLSPDLQGLARTLLQAGEPSGARPYVERACRILPDVTPAQRVGLADCLTLLGSVLGALGESGPAEEALRKARSLAESALGMDHQDLIPIIEEQSRRAFVTDDLDAAGRHALKAEAIARRHLRLTTYGLSHSEALRYEAARTNGLDLALSALTGVPGSPPRAAVEAAWDAVVRSRRLILDELIARRRILSAAQAEGLQELMARLDADRRRLAHAVAMGPSSDSSVAFALAVRSLMRQQEATERELAARSAPFRRLLDEQEIGWSRVSDALPRQTALVAYVRYQRATRHGAKLTETPSYLAFIRSASRKEPQVVALGEAGSIDALVAGWRERIARASQRGLHYDAAREADELATAGDKLRKAIWDPIEARLGGERMVLVVPDGALYQVNLAALPAAGGGFIVESDRRIHQISTERELTPPARPSRGSGLLAVGNPDFDNQPKEPTPEVMASVHRSGSLAALGERSIPPLPAAGEEVAELAEQWREAGEARAGKLVVLVGADATKAALWRLAPGRRVIHLATHGFFEAGTVADKAPAGSTPSEWNPLLATGLALAGSNARTTTSTGAPEGRDGIMLGEEVLSLDLTGVEWVVLSACGTGLGPVQAREGVHDLGRAFQGAGAATVVTTLWEVDDAATRSWMKALYRARLSGSSTADAMRTASLELIAAARKQGRPPHPYDWGGFIATGDWR